MSSKLVLLPVVEDQIDDALVFTFSRFGEAKYLEYRALIDAALVRLEASGLNGTQRPDTHPDAWTYHIARGTKRARHLFLYRIRQRVEIGRFLYDGMDLPTHWPGADEWSAPG
jgi:plasmid stabilization system protein ParE